MSLKASPLVQSLLSYGGRFSLSLPRGLRFGTDVTQEDLAKCQHAYLSVKWTLSTKLDTCKLRGWRYDNEFRGLRESH